MEISSEVKNESLIIKPNAQRIDSSVSSEFKTKVLDLLNKPYKILLIDFSEIEFIDSSALGSLISILKSANLQNASLAICGAKFQIVNLFKLTRLNKVFIVFEDVDEAEKFFMNKK